MPPISYTNKTLVNKERVVYAASLHGFCFFIPTFLIIIGMTIFFFDEIQEKADESEAIQSYRESLDKYVEEVQQERGNSNYTRSTGTFSKIQDFFVKVFKNFVDAMPKEVKEYLKEANHIRLIIFGVLLTAIGLVKLINSSLAKISTEQVVTSKKIVYKKGFIRVNEVEIPLSRIEGVKVYQTAFDRMLNRGNVLINGIGMEQIEIKKISKPIKFRNAAYTAIDKFTDHSNHLDI
jgi:uncharacterized membrane protein YdbT with pleckstrin-like domain